MQNDFEILTDDQVIRPKGDLVIRIERDHQGIRDGAHDNPGAQGR